MLCHVLVVDDDERLRQLIKKFLVKHDFIVSIAASSEEALQALACFSFDIIILDVMLPGQTGIDFATYIRKSSHVPILMLTACNEIENRIEGLEAGVDDYMAKPFDPRELVLRVNSITKRRQIQLSPLEIIPFGLFLFDTKHLQLTKENISIFLTPSETSLLLYFLKNQDKVIMREELVLHCGDMGIRSIDVQVTRLRNKIEEDPKNPLHLQTIRGKGYVFFA